MPSLQRLHQSLQVNGGILFGGVLAFIIATLYTGPDLYQLRPAPIAARYNETIHFDRWAIYPIGFLMAYGG